MIHKKIKNKIVKIKYKEEDFLISQLPHFYIYL